MPWWPYLVVQRENVLNDWINNCDFTRKIMYQQSTYFLKIVKLLHRSNHEQFEFYELWDLMRFFTIIDLLSAKNIGNIPERGIKIWCFFLGDTNEVSTCHDMKNGQKRYPTLVVRLINFTKAEPDQKWLDQKRLQVIKKSI